MDIRQLEQQINKAQINADAKRKQARAQRENAYKMYGDNDARRQWMQNEADKLDGDADQIDTQIQTLRQELQDKQKQLGQKMSERSDLIARHQQELQALDAEITNLSGDTSLTL